MERHSLHGHAAVGVAPQLRGHRLPCGAVHDLPPAGDIVVGVHLHQLRADALHQRDGHGVTGGGVEAGHNVALLHLVRVRLGPRVVLAGGVIGGVDLCVGILQLLRKVGAVAVADGICAPLFQDLQRFGHHVQIGRDRYAPGHSIFFHGNSPLPLFSSIPIGGVIDRQHSQQQRHPQKHDA